MYFSTGAFMEKFVIQRTNTFRWNSKNSLYNYFLKYYNIRRDIVNNEIRNSIQTFRLRQGQPYRAAELWQKVGITLEKNNDTVREFLEDDGRIASYICEVSPFTLKRGWFVDIGIVSIPLALQYGMSLFISYKHSGKS